MNSAHCFSRRVPGDLSPSPWHEAVEAARARGGLVDLTIANPHAAGLVTEALGDEPIPLDGAAAYEPNPRGLPSARTAIAAEYAARGIAVDPDHILVTASTSEAWSLVFKTLCDPGDSVLIPRPGYPLIETLAPLDGVEPTFYDLDPKTGWGPTAESLEIALAPGAAASARGAASAARTRIIAAVSPANPTGRILRRAERRLLEATAGQLGAAVVIDEVFARYPLSSPPHDALPSAIEDPRTLTFVLDGVSKSCGLPGLKIGWIVVAGPGADDALQRLEHVADAYLSPSAPAQAALASIFAAGARIRAAVQARTTANLATLRAAVAASGSRWALEEPEAGWTAVLRDTRRAVPTGQDAGDPAEELLARGILVHPGWLFDLPDDRIAVSLLPDPTAFRSALGQMDRIGTPIYNEPHP